MSNNHFTRSSTFSQSYIAAKQIDQATRQQIAVSALAGKTPISNLSRHHGTSRKFVYAQKAKASAVLNDAFSEKDKDSKVLFYIPVTKAWLQQATLSLILTCHSSYGGVIEFFRDLLDQHICKGTIFNIVQCAFGDGGKGLRSGQQEAWPDVPCRGDVFHPLYDIGKLVAFLKNRAEATLEAVEKLEAKMAKAKKKSQGTKYSKRLGHAREEAATALQLKNDISTLASWLKSDILSVTGPNLTTRQELLNFVVDELKSREVLSPHRIKPVRRLLEGQGEDLLRFVEFLDTDLQHLADIHSVDLYFVRQVFELQAIPIKENRYWERAADLYRKMGARFYDIQEAIQSLIGETVRASSIVENLNSRLRNYFFLRKTLRSGYLELLQFFLNHRRFMRSTRCERVNKSPKELLTGEFHDHWLELLGYKMFKTSSVIDDTSISLKNAA